MARHGSLWHGGAVALAAAAVLTTGKAETGGSSVDSTPPAPCVALPSGLTHWWRAEGTPVDVVGGDHAVPVGAVTYEPGFIGQAFRFGSGHLRLTQAYGGSSTAEVTVMGWIKTVQTGPEAWQAILSSKDSSYLHFQTASVGGSAIYTNPGSAGFNQIPSFGPSPTGVWRHVALTAKSGEIRVYENGVIVGQTTAPYSYITQAAEVLVGAGYQNGRPFPGLVDELQLYGRALSQNEIQAVFTAGNGGFCISNISDGDVAGLIAAINIANSQPGADVISLAPNGTYTLTTNYDSENGLPVVTDALTINGNGATIRRNTAQGTPDFRLLMIHATHPAMTVTLSNVTITNGRGAGTFQGGGIRFTQGTLNLNDSRIQGNTATIGGGLYTAAGTTTTIMRGTIDGNVADNQTNEGQGGGIYSGGTTTITDSTVSGNTARLKGGGIFAFTGGTITVIGSTVTANSAHSPAAPTSGYGGGIFNWAGSTAVIANSTIASNFTNFGGGGLYNNGTMTTTNSTVFGNNSVQYGSGILNDSSGSATVGNTILAQNKRNGSIPTNCNAQFGPPIVSAGHNLSDDATCSAYLNQSGDLNNAPAGMDPGGLLDNGGPTRTIALVANSAAIDAGNDARCAAAPIGNRDQRGLPRPAAVHCDIGAFEVQGGPGDGIWQSRNAMPTARLGASAVNLGGRMYVIGGATLPNNFPGVAAFGVTAVEAYDPTSNTWTVATPLPIARVYANGAAVINNRIYLPGGSGCDAPFCRETNTLYIFDPSAGPNGSWTSGSPMPAGMLGGTSVAINGQLYVTGGWSVGAPRSYFWRFDPASATWTPLPNLPSHHTFGASTVIGGKLYLSGGENNPQSLDIYDPGTNTWSSKVMPLGYQHHAAMAIGDWLVLAGGSQVINGIAVSTRTVVAYDTLNGTWTTASPVASAGGPYSGTAGQPVALQGGSTGTFAPIPYPLDLTAGTSIGGAAFLAGGWDAPNSRALNNVFGMKPVQRDVLSYVWDFGDGTQGSGPAPAHTYALPGTYTATLTVSTPDGRTGSASATVTISSFATQAITFTSTPPNPALVTGQYGVTATGGGSGNPVTLASLTPTICTVSGGTVRLVGVGTCSIAANQAGGPGYFAAPQTTQDFAVTSPAEARTWVNITAAIQGPTARVGHRMVYDSTRDKVILFGGQTSEGWSGGGQTLTGQLLGDMWEWDGSTFTWTRILPADGVAPVPRSFFGMAYDRARDRVVLYGGKREAVHYSTDGETWEWNPATRIWTYFPGASQLDFGGRRGSELAYDPNLGQVILFGGRVYWGEMYGNTWVWNGATWTQLPNPGPAGREAHTLTTDYARSKVVLYGGNTNVGDLGDTWEWNGSAWTQVATPPLAQRAASAAAYDPLYGQTVLFGGISNAFHNTTYGFAGTNWSSIPTVPNPPGLESAMAFDGRNIVLFGGRSASGPVNQTWVLGRASTVPITQTITFTSTPPNPGFVGTQYTVLATGGGSGNPIVISSLTPSACTVAGTIVNLAGVGACTIAADQAGAGRYLPAPRVTQVFQVISSVTVNVPADIVVEAAGPAGAAVTFAASATDPLDSAPVVTCSASSGSVFPIGQTTVVCVATNSFGASASASFRIFVGDSVAPAIIGLAGSIRDMIFRTASAVVTVEVSDAVGVLQVTVNGVAFTRVDGSPMLGNWRGTLPVTPLQPLTVNIVAEDGSTNSASRAIVIDSDGIDANLDHPRNNAAIDQSSIYSSEFNDGTTMGVLVRGGHVIEVQSSVVAGEPWIEATMVEKFPTNTSGGLYACPGVNQKSINLINTGDSVDIKCVGTTLHVRVKQANSYLLVDKRYCPATGPCGQGTYYARVMLTAGQGLSTGSPITADPDNTEPVEVTIIRTNLDGSEDIVGSYQLDPGETADTEIVPGATPEEDRVTFSVITGEVELTIGSDTVIVGEGETVTSRVVQLVQTISFEPIPVKLFGDPAFALTAPASSGLPVSYSVSGSCTLSGAMVTPNGTGTCTVTASQQGNLDYLPAAPVARTFQVWHAWSGLLEPVNQNGSSIFKLGSTVPLKFELIGASGAVTNLQARVYLAKVSDSVIGTEVEASSTSSADAGNVFRYSSGHYQFNLGTKALSDGTWQIRIDLLDGNPSRIVVISLKK